jgi:hypothetical protein
MPLNRMQKLILRAISHVLIWLQRSSQVAQFEDIRISDFRRRSAHFPTTLIAAQRLVKETDPHRYSRVTRHIRWIVNRTLDSPRAQYDRGTQTCTFEFEEPQSPPDYPYWIAWHASALVHEATHGLVEAHGIRYTEALRARIERLCVTEQNRFLCRLAMSQPEMAKKLHREFDESKWHAYWKTTPKRRFLKELGRIASQWRESPD